jgi:hypothetical protein
VRRKTETGIGDQEHDPHVAQQLLTLVQPDFSQVKNWTLKKLYKRRAVRPR